MFQVNGKDVSNLAHEEAVNEFLKAPEPILVEVKRRAGPATLDQKQTAIIGGAQSTGTITSIESPATESPKCKSTPTVIVPQQRSNTTSIGVQTDVMSSFDSEYLFDSNESPTSAARHLNSQAIQSNRHSHHHHHRCNVLSECIVPPDIDIEVIRKALL